MECSDADRLPEYSVKCIEIKRIRGEDFEKAQKALEKDGPTTVKAKMLGPTTFVALLGCFISLVLFAFSIQQQDGMGMLADICLSFLSTLIGLGNKWTLNLPTRKSSGQFTPKGDVVIRYPKGNFVVVRCTEDVARELFFAPENIEYLVEHPWKYRMIALVGTIILMFGVIFLGNAGTNVQVAYAVSFMVLNAGFWIVAALPQRYHWDTSCFKVIHQAFDEHAQPPEICPPAVAKNGTIMDEKDPKNTQKLKVNKSLPLKRKPYVSYNKTFTQALWRVIVATQDIEWIKRSKSAPATEAWTEWLFEAVAHAESMPDEPKLVVQPNGPPVAYYQMPEWDPQAALVQCLKRHANDTEKNKRKFHRSSTPATFTETADTFAGAEVGKDEGSSTSVQVARGTV